MRNKTICIVLLTFLSGSVLNAQNVGINTTTPQNTLDVRGSIRFGGNSNFMRFDSATGKFEWVGASLFTPISQRIISHSASSEGLYAGGGKLDYRNDLGNPVFSSDWTNGNGYFSGKLGIGINNPSAKLQIYDGASGITPFLSSRMVVESNSHSYINLLSPDPFETGILFGSGTNAASGVISYNNTGTTKGFLFANNGNQPRMVIDNAGRVGIGTTSPQNNLHVYTGASGTIAPGGSNLFTLESAGSINMAFLTPDAGESTIWFSKPSKPSGGGIFYNNPVAPDGFVFRTNNISSMAITNTGRVGIGSYSPLSKLHVYGEESTADGNGAAIQLSNGVTGSGFNNWWLRAGATGTTTPAGGFSIGDNNGYRFVINNAGYIGIGTTNPEFKLDVRNGSINTDSVYRIGTITVLAVPGSGNLFVGKDAGKNNTGYYNSFLGSGAGLYNTTGHSNSFFGFDAGWNNSTGEYNTAVGYDARATTGFGPLTNTTAIGSQAFVDASNKVRIGNYNVTSIGGQVDWSIFSDGRFKHQVQEDIQGLAFIKKLRTVSYLVDLTSLNNYYSAGKSEIDKSSSFQQNTNSQSPERQSGFIAQEVEQAAKELGFSFSGVDKPQNEKALYGLRYGNFVVPLVKAVQEQQSIIETMQKQIEAAKAEIPMQIGKQQVIIEDQNRKIEMLMKEIAAIKEKLK